MIPAWLVGFVFRWLVGLFVGSFVVWLVFLLAGWLVGWFAGWLFEQAVDLLGGFGDASPRSLAFGQTQDGSHSYGTDCQLTACPKGCLALLHHFSHGCSIPL